MLHSWFSSPSLHQLYSSVSGILFSLSDRFLLAHGSTSEGHVCSSSTRKIRSDIIETTQSFTALAKTYSTAEYKEKKEEKEEIKIDSKNNEDQSSESKTNATDTYFGSEGYHSGNNDNTEKEDNETPETIIKDTPVYSVLLLNSAQEFNENQSELDQSVQDVFLL